MTWVKPFSKSFVQELEVALQQRLFSEKGLHYGNPKKNPDAEFIAETEARQLQRKNLDDLLIERPCLEILQNSQVIHQIQIINGMEEGNITKALNGEPIGTIIYKE